jgi:DNA primase
MTGLIPRPFIDELLNRTEIVDLIDGYVPLKKRGLSFTACCPFHTEKTPSFNVIAKKQFYHCFGCGASGNAISFVMQYLNLGFVEAVETLAARAGMQVPREGIDKEKEKLSGNLYQLLQRVANFYQHTLKTSGQIAVNYLKNRGVSGEVARTYQIGYAPPGWHTLLQQFKSNEKELVDTGMLIQKDDGSTYDRYRQRITFPIHDRHGRIIGFGGRALESEQKPKYLNSPETVLFQKSRELYGLHQIISAKSSMDSIIIVEGYMDVIALAQHGIVNCVATLGTATSIQHIQLLSKHTKRIIFCFDGDQAGRQAAWRGLESALPQLNDGIEVSFVFLPDGHDPDSLVRAEGQQQFLHRLQQATPLNQYFFDTLTYGLDHTNLAGKTQLVLQAKPYILKMNEGPFKQLMLDELSRLTRIESHRLHQLMSDPISEKNDSEITISRSPARLAIALLLQHPELFQACHSELNTDVLAGSQHTVLTALMEQIAKHPNLTTAAIVENWRDSPYFEAMNKLAAWDHKVPEESLLKEFVDIVLFLVKQHRENTIQDFIKKARNHGLSTEERLQLQTLLKQRHKNWDGENINKE